MNHFASKPLRLSIFSVCVHILNNICSIYDISNHIYVEYLIMVIEFIKTNIIIMELTQLYYQKSLKLFKINIFFLVWV